jgi:hypothetical protein
MRAARAAPTTTGSIGTPAAAYCASLAIARLQKWGGVHRNSTSASSSAKGPICGFTAAAPASTAKLPARPPMTMFHGVRRFSPSV